jgi:hypothetical protein
MHCAMSSVPVIHIMMGRENVRYIYIYIYIYIYEGRERDHYVFLRPTTYVYDRIDVLYIYINGGPS